MKIGVNLSIDVTKLNKARFYQGKNGTYADLTVFIDTESQDEYGKNGGITESQTKEEREAGQNLNYVGNCKVFWKAGNTGDQAKQAHARAQQPPQMDSFDDSDIPF